MEWVKSNNETRFLSALCWLEVYDLHVWFEENLISH